ncbi:MAG: hypothetical protein NT039_00450 [Candidatus Berkelbacteria bacterium]|nr:hypothetical protein [Candidatus Berkelbacteria bacterium]
MPEDTPEETAIAGGKTLGDLIAVMREALNGPDDPVLRGAGFTFDELQRGAGGGWDKTMKWPLDEGSVVALAQLLTDEIVYELQVGLDESYDYTLKCGHALLRLLHTTATEMGVNIPLEEVDVPLSPTEAMVQAGLVETVEGGVNLTDEGRAAAREVTEQIDALKE